jgi:2-polyprenyl-3-methyl-5-hydroxy-6-metoxy-1,4-benzoquinol methylase
MRGTDVDAETDKIINFAAYRRRAWISEKARQLAPGATVLDAGAGECQYRGLFAHCTYKAQDFAQYTGTESGLLKESWRYGALDYVCDIAAIPVADGAFDAVLCSEVLEHVAQPIDVIRELARVLRPGGKLWLTAPLASGLHQRPHHYYGGYTPHFYERFLPAHQLEIAELNPLGGLMLHVAQEIHRVGRMLDAQRAARLSPWMRLALLYWLPRYLSAREHQVHIEEFTVGYMVEAVKRE